MEKEKEQNKKVSMPFLPEILNIADTLLSAMTAQQRNSNGIDKFYMQEIVYGRQQTNEDDDKLRKFLRRCYINVYAHVLKFLIFLGPFLFLSLLLIPKCWPIVFAYVFWIIYDRNTSHRGGRRLAFGRRLKCWEYVRDYFPIKMVKTVELPSDRRYIFSVFPHGILCFGMTCNILTDVNHFDVAYPGLNVYAAVLETLFYIPILRDLALFFGLCSASADSIQYLLNGPEGTVCVIVVGGVKEALNTRPETYKLVLRDRKGFVKLALKTGSSLVPVFSFGETNTYNQPTCKSYVSMQQKIWSKLKVPFVLLRGRGYFQDFFGILPYKRQITTVVGGPIDVPKVDNPSREIIDEYHERFTTELENLFNKFKHQYDDKREQATLQIE